MRLMMYIFDLNGIEILVKIGFYVIFFTFFYLGKFLYVLKRPVIATQPFKINCLAIETEDFKR